MCIAKRSDVNQELRRKTNTDTVLNVKPEGMASRGTNPFMTDDDDGFSPGYSKSHGGRSRTDCSGFGEYSEERYNQLMEQKHRSEQNTIESTRRCLSSIYESEKMGTETAEELTHQGEQLNNVERKVHDINQSLNQSQKHLNNIKSVFGGIKNWFTKEKKQEPAPTFDTKPNSQLQESIERSRNATSSSDNHPVMRMRQDDQQYFGSSRKRNEADEIIDQNLDEMSHGVDRLKMLAMGLGTEIGRQNEQLDRINAAVDPTSLRIEDQNRQMKRQLKS